MHQVTVLCSDDVAKVYVLLLNGGPAFVYRNPDRTPHSFTWLPGWQTKSADIDVKQICNQDDSSKRNLFGNELTFSLAVLGFKLRTSELALQTLDVIFHSFYLRKSGNNDSEIWRLNFEVWSPKSEVWILKIPLAFRIIMITRSSIIHVPLIWTIILSKLTNITNAIKDQVVIPM